MAKLNAIILILLVSILTGSFMAFAGYKYGTDLSAKVTEDLSTQASLYQEEAQKAKEENNTLRIELNDTQTALVDQSDYVDMYGQINFIPDGFARYISDSGVTFLYPQYVTLNGIKDAEDTTEQFPVAVTEITNDDATKSIHIGVMYKEKALFHEVVVSTVAPALDPVEYVTTQLEAKWGQTQGCKIVSETVFTNITKVNAVIDETSSNTPTKCSNESGNTPYIVNESTRQIVYGEFDKKAFLSVSQFETFVSSITLLP